MPVASISCPRCRTPYESATAPALGSSVSCAKCGTRFTVSRSNPVANRPPAPRKSESVQPAPTPRAAPSPLATLVRNPLLIPLLAGALLLAGMGTALAVYFVAVNKTPLTVVEHAAKKRTPPPAIQEELIFAPREEELPPVVVRNDRPEEIPAPQEATEEGDPKPPVVVKNPPDKPVDPLDIPPDQQKVDPTKPAPVVKVKPLSRQVRAALDMLAKRQNADGSWSAAEAFGGFGFPGVADRGDVANTSIAALALLRAGVNPREGWGANNLRKALGFVLAQVEKSDKDSLFVTDLKGTQIQHKIGTYADTFLAALLLAEVKGTTNDPKSEARITAALEKIIGKMQRNQKADGTWANEGWAPILSQALGSRALNKARQAGVTVDDAVLERTAKHARDNFEKAFRNLKEDAPREKIILGPFEIGGGGGMGAAGVALYAAAAYIGALQDAVQTHRHIGEGARGILNSPNSTEQERKEAQEQLKKLDDWEKILTEAVNALVKKLADDQFVRGFGSDGGEEYLSYTIITETLHTKNSKELPKWDKLITDRLLFAQNQDGTWAGQHCITGRTFCTATALLTLMADRASASRSK